MAVISAPYSASAGFGRGGWRDLDWLLLLVVVVLSVWGCVTVVSATLPKEDTFVARSATTTHEGAGGDAAANAAPAIHAIRLPVVDALATGDLSGEPGAVGGGAENRA
jgi:uncharacterized protein YceK